MNYAKLLFPACIVDDADNLYYVTHEEHVIKKLDLRKGKTEYIDNPEGYIPTEWYGVDKLFFSDGKLYLFEQNGKRMLQYSLEEKISRCFDLNCNISNCNNLAACTIYDNTLFIFHSFANRVVKINLDSGKIVSKKELCPNIDYIFNREKDSYCVSGKKIDVFHKLYSCGCQVNNDMWLFTERKQMVLKYDLSTEKYVQYFLPQIIKGCVHAIWKNELFYILSVEGNVYSWDFFNNKVEILFDCRNEYVYPCFGMIAVTDETVWLLPCLGEHIYIINLKNKEKKRYSAYPEDFKYYTDPNRSKFYGYDEDKRSYYYAMHSANYILVIEKRSGKETWLKPVEPDLNEKTEYYKNNYPIQQYDELEFGLEGYLMILAKKRFVSHKKEERGLGESVWHTLKK